VRSDGSDLDWHPPTKSGQSNPGQLFQTPFLGLWMAPAMTRAAGMVRSFLPTSNLLNEP
jgi:hypothetical protein